MPFNQPDHTKSFPHPEVSFPMDQAGRASSQASGTISYLSCSLLRQLHMVRLVLRVREKGRKEP